MLTDIIELAPFDVEHSNLVRDLVLVLEDRLIPVLQSVIVVVRNHLRAPGFELIPMPPKVKPQDIGRELVNQLAGPRIPVEHKTVTYRLLRLPGNPIELVVIRVRRVEVVGKRVVARVERAM